MFPRRNLVILLAHGLRSDAVGDSHVWPLVTPNFRKLAGRSHRLVGISACPADWGGMTSLLTGLHARQHGFVEPQPRLAASEGWVHSLVDAGYFVAGVGNVEAIAPWLNESVVVAGVEEMSPQRCAYLAAMERKNMLAAVQQQRRQRLRYGPFEPDRLLTHPDDDVDGFIITQARRALATMPVDQPWALVVIFSGPGNDLPPPTMYSDVIDSKLLEQGFALAELRQIDSLADLDYPLVMLQRLEPMTLGRLRADYLGRVCLLDFGMGRLDAAMNARADRERTWLVLSSDRGQLLGEHGLLGHRSFLCGAIEVPVIIAPPEPVRDKVYDTTGISTVDVAATIAALGGCDALGAGAGAYPAAYPGACPGACPGGRSLLPLLYDQPVIGAPGVGAAGLDSDDRSGGGPRSATACISEYGRRFMLETERHKLILDVETHRAVALYDLLNDAGERTNLVDTPHGRNLLDALRCRVGEALLSLRALPAVARPPAEPVVR
ncbi:MAG: sulfatase-like hydrolase/transferase [Phycisphaeraceae bacterium]